MPASLARRCRRALFVAARAALAEFLPARAGLLRVLGYRRQVAAHAGAAAGGTTRSITPTEKVRLSAVLREFRAFLEEAVFADTLENVAGVTSWPALVTWADARGSDFATFLRAAAALDLHRIGRASDVFLAVGAYPRRYGAASPAGVFDGRSGQRTAFDPSAITEDVSHAWLAGDDALPPARGETRPMPDGKAAAYTWCKAPRYGGRSSKPAPWRDRCWQGIRWRAT